MIVKFNCFVTYCILVIVLYTSAGVNTESKSRHHGEKCAQISVVVTQGWSEIMIMKYKQGIHFILSYWFDQKAEITFISFFNF